MTIEHILAEARQHGVHLKANGDQLQIEAAALPSAELLANIRAHKSEILAALCPRPRLTPDGTLVIPFDSPERYHWWKGGQSVLATLRELNAPAEVMGRYEPGCRRHEGGREA